MPTYEYKCENCGEAFEKFQSITAGPIRKCPKCGKNKVKRLISAGGGMIFKGSGFYITDYRSDSYKDAAKGDAPKSESSASSSEGGSKESKSATSEGAKGESKPAAKTEAPAKSEPKAPAKSDTKAGNKNS